MFVIIIRNLIVLIAFVPLVCKQDYFKLIIKQSNAIIANEASEGRVNRD